MQDLSEHLENLFLFEYFEFLFELKEGVFCVLHNHVNVGWRWVNMKQFDKIFVLAVRLNLYLSNQFLRNLLGMLKSYCLLG